MILNWLTIVPVIVCLMCIPQLLWMVSYAWPLNAPTNGGWYARVMISSLLCVTLAALFAAYRTTEASRRAAAKNDAEWVTACTVRFERCRGRSGSSFCR